MTRQTRRRRTDNLTGMQSKLGVDERKLDRKAFAYRWVNEENLAAKTEGDDWDKVNFAAESTDLGSTVSRVVGKHEDGSPKRAYLCQKPKKFHEDDRAALMRRVDDTMTAIRRGDAGQPRDAGTTYIPAEGIAIR